MISPRTRYLLFAATVLGGRLALDMAGDHQAIDGAGQGGPVGADQGRQGGHRRQSLLVQGVQDQPLAKDQPVAAQAVADQ